MSCSWRKVVARLLASQKTPRSRHTARGRHERAPQPGCQPGRQPTAEKNNQHDRYSCRWRQTSGFLPTLSSGRKTLDAPPKAERACRTAAQARSAPNSDESPRGSAATSRTGRAGPRRGLPGVLSAENPLSFTARNGGGGVEFKVLRRAPLHTSISSPSMPRRRPHGRTKALPGATPRSARNSPWRSGFGGAGLPSAKPHST